MENLRADAKRYRKVRQNADAVQPDAETQDFPGVGGQTEIVTDDDSAKALYILLYTKKNGTVHVTKATRSAIIYEDVDTGLSCYPIAWGNWEKQKNQYHGRALVTGIIPNQIFINTMMATAMRHLQLMAFPKIIYNADMIPGWTNEVGQAIAVRNLPPGQSVGSAAAAIQPAEMSGQILTVIDRAVNYTKECLGATDAQMGNVRPDNTSALMVLQTNAEVPLENIRANLHEWVEDIGKILLDMMGTYYGKRPVVVERDFEDFITGPGGVQTDPQTGLISTRTVTQKIVRMFDFSVFKHLWLNLRVDVGATTYFSEIAMTQTLDNLRRDGLLNIIQYLERMPDKLIPRKAELLRELRSNVPQAAPGPMQAAPTSNASGPVQGGLLDADKAIQNIPDATASVLEQLPQRVQNIALRHGVRQ